VNNRRCAVALITALATLITAILLTPGSYAWIVFARLSPGIAASASDGDITSLHASSYATDSEGNGYYEWQECSLSAENAYGGTYSGSFNFDKIDNVAVLAASNIVYLRLDVPIKAGKQIEFSLSYFEENGQRYHFYEGERLDSTTVDYTEITAAQNPTLFDSLLNIEQGFTDGDGEHPARPFISYSYAFSDSDTIPTEFSEDNHYVTESATLSADTYTGEGTDGIYYLFVKLSPNLDAYVESVNYIFEHMPCILDFNLQFSYTVSN
jgi:hypothetical protein